MLGYTVLHAGAQFTAPDSGRPASREVMPGETAPAEADYPGVQGALDGYTDGYTRPTAWYTGLPPLAAELL